MFASIRDPGHVTTQAELSKISNALHDEWFLVDELEHDIAQAEIRLPIYASHWKRRLFVWVADRLNDPPPPRSATLVVRGVTSVAVDDEAGVGTYMVTRVTYDVDSGELRIESGPPCDIIIMCEELDIDLVHAPQV